MAVARKAGGSADAKVKTGYTGVVVQKSLHVLRRTDHERSLNRKPHSNRKLLMALSNPKFVGGVAANDANFGFGTGVACCVKGWDFSW